MYIKTEQTPNPHTLKFFPGQKLLKTKTPYDFPNPESAAHAPLIESLFSIDGIARIMLGEDFIAITCKETHDWQTLSPKIIDFLMHYLMSGKPVLLPQDEKKSSTKEEIDENHYDTETLEIVKQITELINTRIRPAVAADGGDIVFDRFEADSGTVYLHMRGACAGCPSSAYTLKHGIERLLRHFIPEVSNVQPLL